MLDLMDAAPFPALGIGVALFIATDIDDLLLLAIFFADRYLAARNVVAGQFLGIAVLVAASAIAALGALVVPRAWVAVLGLVPLLLGIRRLWLLARGEPDEDESAEARRSEQALERRMRSQTLAVAAVTIANGGDNLAIYIPVFARDPRAIPIYAAVFAVMTAVWCAAGHALANNPATSRQVRRNGHLLLPFVLIALGLWILRDAAELMR